MTNAETAKDILVDYQFHKKETAQLLEKQQEIEVLNTFGIMEESYLNIEVIGVVTQEMCEEISVVIDCGGQVWESSVQKNTKNPEWNE